MLAQKCQSKINLIRNIGARCFSNFIGDNDFKFSYNKNESLTGTSRNTIFLHGLLTDKSEWDSFAADERILEQTNSYTGNALFKVFI